MTSMIRCSAWWSASVTRLMSLLMFNAKTGARAFNENGSGLGGRHQWQPKKCVERNILVMHGRDMGRHHSTRLHFDNAEVQPFGLTVVNLLHERLKSPLKWIELSLILLLV